MASARQRRVQNVNGKKPSRLNTDALPEPGAGAKMSDSVSDKRLFLPAGESLILASASPRRAELLSNAGIPFTICPANVNEDEIPSRQPSELVRLLAKLKAEAVANAMPGRLVLGADTVVALDTRVFGKPQNMDEAVETLKTLSGKCHRVFTGVCIMKSGNAPAMANWSCATKVFFKHLDDQCISRYFSLVNPMDKAGAYAIQQHGDMLVDHIDGLLSNVIGLPVEEVASTIGR